MSVSQPDARKPMIEPGSELWKALEERRILYVGDRPGGFIEGWEAMESRAVAAESALAEALDHLEAILTDRTEVKVRKGKSNALEAKGMAANTFLRAHGRLGDTGRGEA